MKQVILICLCFFVLLNIAGCGQEEKSKIIAQYKYDENGDIPKVSHKKERAGWIKEGMDCYGIVMVCDKDKLPIRLIEVHAKIVNVRPENIKMESLEDVLVNRTVDCNKISLKMGDCWEEVDGELFKTREEAVKFIDEHYPGLRVKHVLVTK